MTDGPIKATGPDTDGAYALLDFSVPPGDQGPPPHVHRHTGEAFYVLDGTLTIRLGDEELTAGAGSFVFVRPGVVHTFAVSGPVPARFLVILSPPGLVGYFEQMLGLPTEATAEHDIELVEEPPPR